MGQQKAIGKKKRRLVVLGAIAAILITGAIVFAQFVPMGYRMTIALHGFTEITGNVYVNHGYGQSAEDALGMISEAQARVSAFFGSVQSNPVIILCDDAAKLAKMGGDHDIATVAAFQVLSYIAISPEYLNVDILAHELTHAETHYRAFKGKVGLPSLPTWFDEGIALQNDEREIYSQEAWEAATENGRHTAALSGMDTAAEFYGGSAEDRRYRYILSKHELAVWIKENGAPALLDVLDQLNQGENFEGAYSR